MSIYVSIENLNTDGSVIKATMTGGVCHGYDLHNPPPAMVISGIHGPLLCQYDKMKKRHMDPSAIS